MRIENSPLCVRKNNNPTKGRFLKPSDSLKGAIQVTMSTKKKKYNNPTKGCFLKSSNSLKGAIE